jgi:hypothetical protein
MMIPNIWKHQSHVPNHQSETVKSPLFAATTSDHHVRIPLKSAQKTARFSPAMPWRRVAC